MPEKLFCRSIIDYLVAFLSCFVNDLEEPEEVGACWSCGAGANLILNCEEVTLHSRQHQQFHRHFVQNVKFIACLLYF